MRLLLVEDTRDVADAILSAFAKRGYAVDLAQSLQEADDALAVQHYDVLILDINLPDGSGLDLLKAMRARKIAIPVLMLTARLDVDDRIEALDLGADDYVMKPFDLRELDARVRALARRATEDVGGVIAYGDLTLDPAGRTAELLGAPLALTRREFALLEILLCARGRVLPKERIYDRMFEFDSDPVGVNAIEVYVARLRKKLGESNLAIRTLRGLGYQLSLDDA